MTEKTNWTFITFFMFLATLIFISYLTALLVNTNYEFVSVYDDSYIFYQFADEILDGHPFQYHKDMVRTDGVTSKLYLLLVLLMRFICPDINFLVIVNYLTGHVFFLISIFLFYRVIAHYASEKVSLAGTFLFTLSPNIHWAFFSNMDSQLMTFLFCIFMYSLVYQKQKLLFAVTVTFVFTRPEALLLSIVIAFSVREKKYLALIGIIGAYFYIRYNLFGSFQVNSYVYSTIHGDFFNVYTDLLKQCCRYLFFDPDLTSYFFPGLVLGGMYYALGQISGPDRTMKSLALIYVLFFFMIVFLNYPRPDTFLRYLSFLHPLTILFIVLLISKTSISMDGRKVIVMILAVFNLMMMGACIGRFAKMGKHLYFNHVAAAKWLNACGEIKDGLLCGDVGVLGFMSEFPIVDLVGLVSADTIGFVNHGDGVLFEHLMSLSRKPNYAALDDRVPSLSGTSIFRKVISFHHYDEKLYRSRDMTIYRLDWNKAVDRTVFPQDQELIELDSVNIADLGSEASHRYRHTSLPGQRLPSFVFESNGIIEGGRAVNDETMTFDVSRKKPGKAILFVWRGNLSGANLIHVHVNGQFYCESVVRPDIVDEKFAYYRVKLDKQSILDYTDAEMTVRIVNPEMNLIPIREVYSIKLYSEK